MTCFTSAITSFGSPIALTSRACRIALTSSLFLLACSGQGHPCIEHERTIKRGVYGEVVYISPELEYTPLYDVQLRLSEFGSQLMVDTRSNEDGLYEFELPVSISTSYSLCSDFAGASCWSFTSTGLVRLDLVAQEGSVFWDDGRYGECP